jgi:hypothetical protein
LACVISAACGTSLPLDRTRSLGPPAAKGSVEDVPVRGYPIEVELNGDCKKAGELMAVDTKYIWVLQSARAARTRDKNGPERLLALRLDQATSVSVEVHPSDSAMIGVWTALGAISTASHGGFLVLSLPVWLVTGISSSVSASSSNDADGEPKDFNKLFHFARFPQGMPEHLRTQGRLSGC